MPYIPPDVVEKAREMDLLTYLRTYEPQELVHFGGSTYCTICRWKSAGCHGSWYSRRCRTHGPAPGVRRFAGR